MCGGCINILKVSKQKKTQTKVQSINQAVFGPGKLIPILEMTENPKRHLQILEVNIGFDHAPFENAMAGISGWIMDAMMCF